MSEQVCEKCRPIVKAMTKYYREKHEAAIKKMENQIEEIKKRLAAYENAHTPYSRRLFKPRPKAEGKKRGRPSGMPGVTRPNPTPDKTIESKFKRCPKCKKDKLIWLGRDERFVEELPKPQPVKVTKFISNAYLCKHCNKEVVAIDKDCPDAGRFGKHVLAEASLMKYEERLPLRKIENVLQRRWNLNVTPSSILNFTERVSDALKPFHEELIRKIRASPFVHADETSIRINGINYWIWIFVAKDAVLCVIRKSRGKKVVKEILGGYKGVLICDGLKSYSQFGFTMQRCWAHLLREAKETDMNICKDLCGLFADAKSGLIRMKAEERLRKIISKTYSDVKSMKLIKKIKNGFENWFTFLEYDVEPTNNAAEQALREHVVIRKIIGGLRSMKGARTHEVIMSCLATWKMQGLNSFDQMVKYLGRS